MSALNKPRIPRKDWKKIEKNHEERSRQHTKNSIEKQNAKSQSQKQLDRPNRYPLSLKLLVMSSAAPIAPAPCSMCRS
jgi:hypothetical protein